MLFHAGDNNKLKEAYLTLLFYQMFCAFTNSSSLLFPLAPSHGPTKLKHEHKRRATTKQSAAEKLMDCSVILVNHSDFCAMKLPYLLDDKKKDKKPYAKQVMAFPLSEDPPSLLSITTKPMEVNRISLSLKSRPLSGRPQCTMPCFQVVRGERSAPGTRWGTAKGYVTMACRRSTFCRWYRMKRRPKPNTAMM